MAGKKAKILRGKSFIIIILSAAAGLLLLLSFFITNVEGKRLVRVIGYVLVVAGILSKAFSGKFDYKPTREELEERMFGKENSQVEK